MVLNIISFAIGVIGTILAIITWIDSKKKAKKHKTIYWEDVNNAVKVLSHNLNKDYIPDLIYTPNIKGGIIIRYLCAYFNKYIPSLVGLSIEKKRYSQSDKQNILNNNDYITYETNKWYAYIPKTILKYKEKKLLIVDDFAMSGDFLEILKKTLISNGFNKDNIKTYCIATSHIAIGNGKSPDYYWKIVESMDIYLPWGKPE